MTLFAIMAIMIYHFIFVIPLLYGGVFLFQAVKKIQTKDFSSAITLIKESQPAVATAKKLYSFARPTFLLFSLAQTTDDLFAVHEKPMLIMNTSINLQNNAHEAFALLLKKKKINQMKKKQKTSSLIQSIKESLSVLEARPYIPQSKNSLHGYLYFSKYKEQMAECD